MSLIEGIGDEVIELFAILTIVTVCLIAWKSTAIRDLPQIRTIVILERRSQNGTNNDVARGNAQIPPNSIETNRNPSESLNESNAEAVSENPQEIPENQSSTDDASNEESPLQREVNAKRISYFNADTASTSDLRDPSLVTSDEPDSNTTDASPGSNITTPIESSAFNIPYASGPPAFNISYASGPPAFNVSSSGGTPAFNLSTSARTPAFNIQSSDGPSAFRIPSSDGPSAFSLRACSRGPSALESAEPQSSIRVKIKYLNDEEKIVHGNLRELLGQFRRRCFGAELLSNKTVMLIYQGRVLNEEEQTLENLGLHDNCVLHCIIKIATAQNNNSGSASASARPHGGQNSRRRSGRNSGRRDQDAADWNLGSVLCTAISVMLLSAWLAHISYPHLFTLSTTAALISLTALFAISGIGIHFPEYLPSSN